MYIVYELILHDSDSNYPVLENVLFGWVQLAGRTHVNNYKYFGYRISFDRKGPFFSRNVIIFRVDINSSPHMDYINFIVTRKKFCLSLHYNGANSHLLFHGIELIKFKAKDSEIISTPLCLRIITKQISKNNTWLNDWKTGLNEYAYDFVIDFDAIAVADILDIRSYLMKKYEKETVRNSKKKRNSIKKNRVCEANICFSNDVFWL